MPTDLVPSHTLMTMPKKVLVKATTPTLTLHDGYVCRQVFDDGNPNSFTLQSVGFGTGDCAGINTFFSPLGWDHMTSEVIEGFASQKYADRTGQDTLRLIIAVPYSETGTMLDILSLSATRRMRPMCSRNRLPCGDREFGE